MGWECGLGRGDEEFIKNFGGETSTCKTKKEVEG
jgi:hypothetical protein